MLSIYIRTRSTTHDQLRDTAITCAACTIEFPILRFIEKHFDKLENQFLEIDHGDKLIQIKHVSEVSVQATRQP